MLFRHARDQRKQPIARSHRVGERLSPITILPNIVVSFKATTIFGNRINLTPSKGVGN
jgi:hypothetical protein